jgi:CheY-like chemotaxis protein
MHLAGNSSVLSAPKLALEGKRVLVVDDNPINLDIAVETLTDVGAQVDYVASGQDALDRVERNGYDLILLDLGMPHVDGWQVGRAIRASALNADSNILIFTASDTGEARRAVTVLRARGLVGKPVDVDDLLAQVIASIE